MFIDQKRALAFALSLLFAGLAHAQDTIINTLRFHVGGGVDCNRKGLSFVLDGDDGQWWPLKPSADCRWELPLKDVFKIDDELDTKLSYVSLRLGGARTGCYKIQPVGNGVGTVEFVCCSTERARNVTIRTDDRFSYLREVTKDYPGPRENRGASRPCTEMHDFDEPEGTIKQVQFAGEVIRLQLGLERPKHDGLGLIVNDLPDLKRQDHVELTSNDVVWQLAKQRVKSRDRSWPGLSTAALAIDIAKLRLFGFEKVEVNVVEWKE